MKKIAILSVVILSFGLSFIAQASTTGTFAGTFGIVRIMPKDPLGNGDLDSVNLYRAMNVPVKNSMLGPGKTIQDTKKALQFICAIRNGSGYECAIFIQKSDVSSLNPVKGIMQYKVTGPDADYFTQLFVTDYKGEYSFVSQEGNFKVEVKPQYFEILFNKGSSIDQAKTERTVVIVNVEDTLKITHSQNFWDSLNYVEDTKSRFLGMQEVLSFIASQNDTTFVYMTEPPELLAGRVQSEFLRQNRYPVGIQQSFQNMDSLDTRANRLRGLVLAKNASRVILMGHDGGVDKDLFSRLGGTFGEAEVLTYVHTIYSTNAPYGFGTQSIPMQTSYVTAAELLLDLKQKGVLDDSSLGLTQNIAQRVLSGEVNVDPYEKALPSFVSCENFVWKWNIDPDISFMEPLRQLLTARCHL